MTEVRVIKRDFSLCDFDRKKVELSIKKAIETSGEELTSSQKKKLKNYIKLMPDNLIFEGEEVSTTVDGIRQITVDQIQNSVEDWLMSNGFHQTVRSYILYREQRNTIRSWVDTKIDFINKYKESDNTANATIDDNSNASSKNVGVLNVESHKPDNLNISRGIITRKLHELFPEFDSKQYVRDLESHIIYKHDENSFSNPVPYCTSITMYPFLIDGIRKLGGLSASPKNLDSFCGIFVNMVHAISGQYAGAVATSEFLLYFTFFAKKEWGDDFYLHPEKEITQNTKRPLTIEKQIEQYFQQIVFTINQPIGARGLQSVFWNVSYFDKEFFEGMFGDFVFPDFSKPDWESLSWVQRKFMTWFNEERLKTMLTFPVESFALVYKDGKFVDEESARFVAEEYARGHSFFTYISDTVDSLSSCCFNKDQKVLWKSSTSGVHLTTLEELHELNWNPEKKNLRIFHNGSWVSGKSIKLPNTNKMYKVVTSNNKEFIMTDNHINVTLTGEKQTSELTTGDYLMFNNIPLQAVPENDEKLSYAQGFVVGSFLGDGSFGSEINGCIYDINFSQNIDKYQKLMELLDIANQQVGGQSKCRLNEVYNNVFPVRISSKELVAFIIKWTNWSRGIHAQDKELNLNCLLQSYEFRRGILDGWYSTDGGNSNRCYTTSSKLAEGMETLITSLGLQSIINISDRTDEMVIIREEVFNRNYPLYCVRWYEPGNNRVNKDSEKAWIKKNNSIYFKIKSIEEVSYSDPVYCIECKNEDEPYFTLPSGLITHNCRLKNAVTTKEFNFTNGNMGVQTGSKSVITLNLSRIIQNCVREVNKTADPLTNYEDLDKKAVSRHLNKILGRVYKYHVAYNELLWEMKDAHLLTVYDAGFIDLNKQYLTIGINGLNQAAEFVGLECNNNEGYKDFCKFIFSTITSFINSHKKEEFGHQITLNCEQVPAESLAVKNYNWDKSDGYWVPEDTNLYASYIFKPNDENISVIDKIILHSKEFAAEELSGGQAAHINLSEHLSVEQYWKLLNFAGRVGCSYFTFNIPNSECDECGFITKVPINECPHCHSHNISYYDRIIGYLTKIKNWASGRRVEQKTRVYTKPEDVI